MEQVDEAQARLLHANVSRAISTVCTHWEATVRTLDPSQWAMFLRSRMLVPDSAGSAERNTGKRATPRSAPPARPRFCRLFQISHSRQILFQFSPFFF